MAILTVDELREHITSALGDDALQRLLDGTEELIVARAGPAGAVTELASGGGRLITLSRPAASITSIKERFAASDEVTLAADDYILWPAGTVIERITGGTNPRSWWRTGRVQTVYTWAGDDDLRALVQLDLCRFLITNMPGIAMETIGAWSQQFTQGGDYAAHIESILSALDPDPQMFVVGG